MNQFYNTLNVCVCFFKKTESGMWVFYNVALPYYEPCTDFNIIDVAFLPWESITAIPFIWRDRNGVHRERKDRNLL